MAHPDPAHFVNIQAGSLFGIAGTNIGEAGFLVHFGELLEQSRSNPETAGLLGQVEDQDIDDIRGLIADTNITLLSFTIIMSTLHLLFEFLAFKSDVDFWKDKTMSDGSKKQKSLAGLSLRSLFIDCVCQIIILLYLVSTYFFGYQICAYLYIFMSNILTCIFRLK